MLKRLLLILSLAATPAMAVEKVAGTADKTAQTEKAEWVDRCDRLAEAKRIECLEKLRAEAQERFLQQEGGKQAAPESKKAATPK